MAGPSHRALRPDDHPSAGTHPAHRDQERTWSPPRRSRRRCPGACRAPHLASPCTPIEAAARSRLQHGSGRARLTSPVPTHRFPLAAPLGAVAAPHVDRRWDRFATRRARPFPGRLDALRGPDGADCRAALRGRQPSRHRAAAVLAASPVSPSHRQHHRRPTPVVTSSDRTPYASDVEAQRVANSTHDQFSRRCTERRRSEPLPEPPVTYDARLHGGRRPCNRRRRPTRRLATSPSERADDHATSRAPRGRTDLH